MPKGFEEITAENRILRLVLRIGGLEKNGKTHFGMTAPGATGILDMDRGLEGVIEKFLPFKTIYRCNFRAMPAETQKDYEARWDTFKERHYTLLEGHDVRTILWDTDTEAWEMARLAFFGKLSQIKPHHYAEINREFRSLIDAAFDHDKNLILICKYKKQYVAREGGRDDDAKWNGKYEEAGFTDMPFIVQANLRTRIVVDKETKEKTPTVEVVNCRHNMQLNGEVFEGGMATFPWVAASIVDGTSPEDWE